MKRKNREKSNQKVRHFRSRKALSGTPERPRLCLSPSINHLQAQVIDDFEQKTVFGLSTKSKDFQKTAGSKTAGNVQSAVKFGKFFAEKAKQQGITKVVFDRSGYLYHGRIKAFADAARESGLSF